MLDHAPTQPEGNAPNIGSAYKTRAIQYGKRDGTPRVEYWIVDASGVIKPTAPTRWHRVELPDVTTPFRLEECAELLYKAKRTQIRDRVDDNMMVQKALADGTLPHDAHLYTWLCAVVGIKV